MKRRDFLIQSSAALLTLTTDIEKAMAITDSEASTQKTPITLFLCGDVMTGRGIDQILPHPSKPQLYEPYVQNAQEYVELAEEINGKIPRPVSFDYIWGDALVELEKIAPDARIINLETSITTSDEFWVNKGIHYRMHPQNMPSLTVAKIDCCVLANNHVLDWGYAGLTETLRILTNAHIKTAGAGANLQAAQSRAILDIPLKGRIIIISCGTESSGIAYEWAASARKAGVYFLTDLSRKTVDQIATLVRQNKHPGDIVIVSIHWGGNWGYRIPEEHIDFAHMLIDSAEIDLLHGHSSHHPIGLEVYKEKLILYGCGDFLNDYEGIGGHEHYRGDLSLMYFASIAPATGKLVSLEMVPLQIKYFRLNRTSAEDAYWLQRILDEHSSKLNCRIELTSDQKLKAVY
ncbi:MULTISPECIES: CapA family protein [Nitrosomonas]|uniref:Poly-gamma-glutamate synthesis protein (Capsule biosynthesis protein) n=2 Tax=Nitrosomonas communis TaxID=44574 RepID=A0A5D3YAT8_9PROT|nr:MULTISPECIES: CapA family protein [Nitrosomonas]TYP78773.1 poly-gamma-glutamate synthesis protein (capsule biosynthesis protein) [Nitrosomonas communis]UVS61929.1 CapA family protein [Nitrosomonas sp. PLL12]